MFRTRVAKSDVHTVGAAVAPASTARGMDIQHVPAAFKPVSSAQANGIFNKNNGFGGRTREAAKKKLDEEANIHSADPGVSLENIQDYITVLSSARLSSLRPDTHLRDVSDSQTIYSADAPPAFSVDTPQQPTSLFRSRVVCPPASTTAAIPVTKPTELSFGRVKTTLETQDGVAFAKPTRDHVTTSGMF